jgi:mRNA-degrading endonuclease RelE of RelBE toxin-antitoxin system
MKLHFHPEAEKEFKELKEEEKQKVRERVEELEKQGTSHENFGMLTHKSTGLNCFRLKVKEGGANHRIIIDTYRDLLVAFGVKHRQKAYEEEYLEKIRERQYRE